MIVARHSGTNLNHLPDTIGPFNAVPSITIAGGSPDCDIQMTIAPYGSAVLCDHLRTHSELILGNHIARSRTGYIGDSLGSSPLTLNRAGNYEKGDCNQ